MSPSDKQLVLRTLEGERAAFGELVERYQGLVRGLVTERLRRRDDVDDVVQETFCKAYEDLGTLRDHSRFAAWLRRIAGNKSVDWERRRAVGQRESSVAEITALYDRPTTDEVAERDAAEHLWRLIDGLSPAYRQVLVLRYVEGCELRQIARFLGVSAPTIHWRLIRAQRVLGARLAQALAPLQGVSTEQREQSRKIMAALPLTVLLRSPDRAAWPWKALAGVGLAAGAVLVGVGLHERIDALDQPRAMPDVLRVRSAEWQAPPLSVLWDPQEPRPGDVVQVTVAGPDLSNTQAAALHMMTDPEYPQDQVIPMEKVDDAWVASVRVPEGAPAVFFHPVAVDDADEAPRRFDPAVDTDTWRSWFKPYAWSLTTRDDAGTPTTGAAAALARMAQHHEAPPRRVLELLNREIASHPENVQAYRQRWRVLRQIADNPEAARDRIWREYEDLRARLPQDPAAWWPPISTDPSAAASLQMVVQRFPHSRYAHEAAYMLASLSRHRDVTEQLQAWDEMVRRFPESPYLDEATGHRLQLLWQIDAAHAAALADSIIDGTLDLAWRRSQEQLQQVSYHRLGGHSAAGFAASVRFELHHRDGARVQALAVARRLAGSGVVDPHAYMYLGRVLAGSAQRRIADVPPTGASIDRLLARELLIVGKGQSTPAALLGRPGFAVRDNLPEHAREEFRRFYGEQIELLRQAFDDELKRLGPQIARADEGGDR